MLAGLDFELPAGDCLAVVGRSGCGKSTLLHVLAGLLAPLAGSVTVGGDVVAAADWAAPARPGCSAGHAAYMFQQRPAAALEDRARERRVRGARGAPAARGAAAARAARASATLEERAARAARGVRSGDALDVAPGASSPGGCASASPWRGRCCMDRGLILLDEPFGSLDAVTRAEMRRWLLEVMAAHPATWVLVTHDVEEAVLLGDRVAVLHGRPAAARRAGVPLGSSRLERTRLAASAAGEGARRRADGSGARRGGRRASARRSRSTPAVGGRQRRRIGRRVPRGDVMQAVVIREVGAFELADVPVPEPGPGEALIRVSVTGLCRTDLKVVRHGHRDLTLPRVPGEEVVGEVVALGPEGPEAARPAGAAGPAASFAPGDRVYVYPGVWCGECPTCRRGAENLCRQMRIMGFHRDGGFAEYVAAPLQSLIRVPEGLGDEEAVFAEPLSCCLNALELGGVGEGDVLGVWGAGPAGTLLSRAGALRGAEVVVVEPDERRRESLESGAGRAAAGERARGGARPVDVAVVAVGDPAGVRGGDRGARAARPPRRLLRPAAGGRRGAAREPQRRPLPRAHLRRRLRLQLPPRGRRARPPRSGRLRVDDLISHRLPLSALDEGLDLVARRAGMKVHLYPERGTP